MNKIIKGDKRSAVAYLNFERRVNPNPMVPVGPNLLGEMYYPVSIDDSGRRVGYSLIEPEEK